jgi:cellulose 1,4-beta-cellobiosidase
VRLLVISLLYSSVGICLRLDSSVVTQFQTDKITQFFIQNNKKIDIPPPAFEGISASSAITPEFCKNQFQVFGDKDRFNDVGGWPQLNKALAIPMVLVMSIWDDVSARLPQNLILDVADSLS